ncbi:MAG: hypothetical protein PHU46_15070 [Rhodocyclaceae bacterium]|nr:hypothetical protein [Rhodocyclaceae bacterium]
MFLNNAGEKKEWAESHDPRPQNLKMTKKSGYAVRENSGAGRSLGESETCGSRGQDDKKTSPSCHLFFCSSNNERQSTRKNRILKTRTKAREICFKRTKDIFRQSAGTPFFRSIRLTRGIPIKPTKKIAPRKPSPKKISDEDTTKKNNIKHATAKPTPRPPRKWRSNKKVEKFRINESIHAFWRTPNMKSSKIFSNYMF